MTGAEGLTALVLAKQPRPGHSKTRLAPWLGPHGAADLADAALHDTLDAVRAAAVARRVLVLDGSAERLPCNGFEVVAQVVGAHVERIIAAFEVATGPAVLVGMDTPQLRPDDVQLDLSAPVDAWLGQAVDGGWWALGLRHARRDARRVLSGVPMSTDRTGEATLVSLHANGLPVRPMRVLRDVDEAPDALAVAAQVPGSRFADRLTALTAVAGGL